MKTDLAISHLTVTPGETARVDISVTNTAEVIDGVTAIVDGINPDWVRLERPLVSVFPDASDSVSLVFDIPRTCPAGDYLVIVRIVSTLDPERQSVQDFWMTVTETIDFDMRLTPSIVTGGRESEFVATIINDSNVGTAVTINAWEPTRAIDCRVEPQSLVLPYGDEADVEVKLRGPRPWFGQPQAHSIVVTAQVGDVVVEQSARFNQKPRIPRGIITALILAAIILLWAIIFLWIIREMRQGDVATKAVATDFFGGSDTILLADVAGSAEGRVVAITSGEGIERITVEARRITRDDVLQPVASVATGEDGSFVLPALLPGRYKLRFSGDGFSDVWFPGVPSESEAQEIKIVPTKVATDEEKAASTGLIVELGGLPGVIAGEILLPGLATDSGEAVPLTVTATLQSERVGGDAAAPGVEITDGAPPEATGSAGGAPTGDAATTGADGAAGTGPTAVDGTAVGGASAAVPTNEFPGTVEGGGFDENGVPLPAVYRIPDLPTPADYRIRVSGPGFETQEFVQPLGGGDQTVLNTVRLSAATGSIGGVLIDQGGSRLGGVKVTARAGDIEYVMTTPTTGNPGEFQFVDLATPETYVLSFELDGYEPESLALELKAGEKKVDVPAQIMGGNGIISGRAVDDTGAALGGVKVTIVSGDVTAETATLTTGEPGTFVVEDLPAARRYTVTFELDGFQTETVNSVLLTAGTQPVGDVQLLRVAAEIRGTIGGIAAPGDVTITLSNGEKDRITVSATNPPGVFAFSGVTEGTYTLTFERAGLERRVLLVRVQAGVDVQRTVILVPGGATP